jgi:serine/threonine protein kinase
VTTERHQRVKEIFLAVCDRPPKEQAACLAEACGGDTELRSEVEGMLGFDRARPEFLAEPALAPDGARFETGQALGDRYRIVAPLGAGGMGDVYRADDLKLGVSVALKFLPSVLARDEAWLARLHREVRIARDVAHPNVCRVYDIAEAHGEHFITMEYIDGEDLATILARDGALPAPRAIEIGCQLCTGLAAAHDRGVLHRDLKPANIMIDGRGHVRIADFGIATLTDTAERSSGQAAPCPSAATSTPSAWCCTRSSPGSRPSAIRTGRSRIRRRCRGSSQRPRE